MPRPTTIILATPLMHNLDDGTSVNYTDVLIEKFSHSTSEKEIRLTCYWGTVVNDVFIYGKRPPRIIHIENIPAHIAAGGVEVPASPLYDLLMVGAVTVSGTPAGTSLLYLVALSLYQSLLDQGYYYGTISLPS